MKVRIKFSKTGALKFVGHLDVMRYFQKLMRRANIPIAYSEGFSPHQVMSFAMPLGIGEESVAEYVDIEINERISSSYAIRILNENSVDNIRILSFKEIPDGKKYNAMSSISAASYEIKNSYAETIPFNLTGSFNDLMKQSSINVTKKTKKSEKVIDLKPYIYDYSTDNDVIIILVSCGSLMNINPNLLIGEVFKNNNVEFNEYLVNIKRTEMYTGTYKTDDFKSLDDVGTDICLTE